MNYITCNCGRTVQQRNLAGHKKTALHIELINMQKYPDKYDNIYQCTDCGSTLEALTPRERDALPPKSSPFYPNYTQNELLEKAKSNGYFGKHEKCLKHQTAIKEEWNKKY